MKKNLILSVGLAVLLLGGLTGTAIAADRSAPGSVLYPLDNAMESAGRFFSGGSEKYEEARLREREQELNAVQNCGDETRIRTAEENLNRQRTRLGEGNSDGDLQNQNQNQNRNNDSVN